MAVENGRVRDLSLPRSRDAVDDAERRKTAKVFLRRHAYLLLGIVLVVAVTGQTLNQRWASPDFWVHLAAVREFANSLFHPANPLVAGSRHDPYLSPYTFALAAVVRVTGADAVTILSVAAIGNAILLLVGMRAFVRRISSNDLAPVFALVFTLVAWGVSPWRWSGFFSLNSLGTVLPLSSTFASAVGLLTIAAMCDVMRGAPRWKLAAVGVGTLLTLLCHPVTAIWVVATGASFLFAETTAHNVKRLLFVGAAVAGATLVAVAWPYYSVWQLVTRSTAFDASNAAMYHAVLQRTFLAFPGFVLLGVRFVRNRRDPLAIAAGLNAAIYVVGYATNHDALGRVLPGVMLMAHVAMAVWVAAFVTSHSGRTQQLRDLAVVVAAIVVVGVVGSAAGVERLVPRALVPGGDARRPAFASLVAPYRPVEGLIAHGDTVVASRSLALGVAALSGKLIAPAAPAPFVDDIKARNRDVQAMLSPQTSRQSFERLAARYHVEWFVVTPSDARRVQLRVLAHELRLERTTSQLRVYRVVSA